MNIVSRLAKQAWTSLPVPIRRSRAAQILRQHAGPLVGRPVPTQRVVRTVEQLDAELRELERLGAISDDDLRSGFGKFRMELSVEMPADPWSAEYRERVFELYEYLYGSPYRTTNEATVFDFESHVIRPFPYSTASCVTAGNHLIGVGHVIRTLDLPPSSRILELGSGWGNTTLALAQLGHSVTAIDIDANFVKLLSERAARNGVHIDVRQGDFALMKELDPGFDAVLFFECFHHAADHLDVLASLDRLVVPGGKVLFAGEPINEASPHPWGLRMDGESLWAIRKHGWLELGFRPDYFERSLARYGWRSTVVDCPETPSGVIQVAQRV